MKKVGKMITKVLITILLIVVVIMIGFMISFAITGKGTIQYMSDQNGNKVTNSIAEKIFIDVNGKKNGLIIRGKSLDNPVLLFISGGPGVPQYWMNEVYLDKYPNHLEDYFTVCWWDYQGECLSYDKNIDPVDLTVDRLANDSVIVADYLRDRFGKEKIYLMAHSGGTPLGLYISENYPEPFVCYFSMAQVVDDGYRRYEEGYKFMKEEFEKQHNQKGLKAMNKLVSCKDGTFTVKNPDTIAAQWENILLMAGCATTHDMRSDCLEIFFPQMYSSCYTYKEKINFWKGKFLLAKSSYKKDYEVNIYTLKPTRIPVYFISGGYDYTCPVTLVRELYEHLEAPEKELYIFKNSAHSPLWEETDQVLEVMIKHVK